MNEEVHMTDQEQPAKSKWFTYGGKVDENLMSLLKETQKTAGIKKFSDFMTEMLNIYRENKQEMEPPQMKVVKKAVTDIMTTTENLLSAMQIIEDDKFKAIEEYRQHAQEVEENAKFKDDKIKELEDCVSNLKQQLTTAQHTAEKLRQELIAESERRKTIEDMIRRVQQLADDAAAQMKKAQAEKDVALSAVKEADDKVAALEHAKKELKNKLEAAFANIDRLQKELFAEKSNTKLLRDSLTQETITRNRQEERLEILEPQCQAAHEKIETLQKELNHLHLAEQAAVQKNMELEKALQMQADKFKKLQLLANQRK